MYLLINELGEKWLAESLPLETNNNDLQDAGIVECFEIKTSQKNIDNALQVTIEVIDVLDDTSVDLNKDKLQNLVDNLEIVDMEDEEEYEHDTDEEE